MPAGNFRVQIEIPVYTPDSDSYGFNAELRVRDSSAYIDWCRVRIYKENNPGTPFVIYGRGTINSVNQGSYELNSNTCVSKYEIRRVGNTISAWYFITSWNQIVAYDFGSRAANLSEILLYCYSNNNRGGSIDFDNLRFRDCCPTGEDLVWTTTSTTTTTMSVTTTTIENP